jgi:hypothetical protein
MQHMNKHDKLINFLLCLHNSPRFFSVIWWRSNKNRWWTTKKSFSPIICSNYIYLSLSASQLENVPIPQHNAAIKTKQRSPVKPKSQIYSVRRRVEMYKQVEVAWRWCWLHDDLTRFSKNIVEFQECLELNSAKWFSQIVKTHRREKTAKEEQIDLERAWRRGGEEEGELESNYTVCDAIST